MKKIIWRNRDIDLKLYFDKDFEILEKVKGWNIR